MKPRVKARNPQRGCPIMDGYLVKFSSVKDGWCVYSTLPNQPSKEDKILYGPFLHKKQAIAKMEDVYNGTSEQVTA